jgi:uncharacterized protein (TIGR00369 family)
MSNPIEFESHLTKEIEEILLSGTEEDKEILKLAIQSIKLKKEKKLTTYLAGFMHLKGEFQDENTYCFTLPITPFIMNPLHIVHGGITATLADSTMGSLIHQKLADDLTAVTSELKINYISPGKGKELICTAKIVNMGSQLCVAECRVTNEEGRLIAIATATFFVVKMDKKW